jgi:hypothetical protein
VQQIQTDKDMRHLKAFLVTFAIKGLSVRAVYAENVTRVQSTIANFAHGGDGRLISAINGSLKYENNNIK